MAEDAQADRAEIDREEEGQVGGHIGGHQHPERHRGAGKVENPRAGQGRTDARPRQRQGEAARGQAPFAGREPGQIARQSGQDRGAGKRLGPGRDRQNRAQPFGVEGQQTAEDQCQAAQKSAPGDRDESSDRGHVEAETRIDAIAHSGAGQIGHAQKPRDRIAAGTGQGGDAPRHPARRRGAGGKCVIERDPRETERGEAERLDQRQRRGGSEIGLHILPFHMGGELVQDDDRNGGDDQRQSDPDRRMLDDACQPSLRRRDLSGDHWRLPPAGRSGSAEARPAFRIAGPAGGRSSRAAAGSRVRT